MQKSSSSVRGARATLGVFPANHKQGGDVWSRSYGLSVFLFMWTFPGAEALHVPDTLLRTYALSGSFASDLEAAAGNVGELSAAFGAREEDDLTWPHEMLTQWTKPLIVLSDVRYALKSALLRRLEQIGSEKDFVALYVTQTAFTSSLKEHQEAINTEPAVNVLFRAAGKEPVSDLLDGVLLLVDGWVGSLAPLQAFLEKHCIHVAQRSELYATIVKAGIGADESSSDPPLPRFLGAQLNDSFLSNDEPHRFPLARIVLCCDPHTFVTHRVHDCFAPYALHTATATECVRLVKSMGSDAPSAKVAQDPWVAFLCGVAASIPPPLDSTPSDLRRLLTSLTGALGHLMARLNISRSVMLGAGFLALCGLATHSLQSPLTQQDHEELCGMYIECGGGGNVWKTGAEMLSVVSNSVEPLLATAYPREMLCYGHIIIEQWLGAQFLAVEDVVCDNVLKLASVRFPIFQEVTGPVSSQTLPFVYGPHCAASATWRSVLHFIGLITGVYPLAYRLCAWGDNSNVAAYQWLLQLKSQACSPMPKKSAAVVAASPSMLRVTPPLFEYDSHGDVGKHIFWILSRVQAELSVSYPQQAIEHGEENPFPHFVRAVISNPKHAHDLANALTDPLFPPALSRLQDGLSIGSHLSDISVEAGCARPWAVNYYAQILASLDAAKLLPLGLAVHQSRALSTSKSTSKRLMGAAFIREHMGNLQASPESESAATEFFAALEALLLGASDRSSFVREECLSTLKSVILAVSPKARGSAVLGRLLDDSLNGLIRMVREMGGATVSGSASGGASSVGAKQQQQQLKTKSSSGAVSSLLIAGSQLLLKSSPYAIVPFLLGGPRTVDLVSASAVLYSLRRASEMAKLAPVDERMFLWRAFSSALVSSNQGNDESFTPSDDLIFAVEELGQAQIGLLRFALLHLIGQSPDATVKRSMRWNEDNMREEVVRAVLHSGSTRGMDLLCELLVESKSQKLIVNGMCDMDAGGVRRIAHLARAAIVCSKQPKLQAQLLSTIKSDLDQMGWWQRLRQRTVVETLLPLLPAMKRELFGIFFACRVKLPATLLSAAIMETAGADTPTDTSLHELMNLMCQVQSISSNRSHLLDDSFVNVGELLTTVVNASPLAHPSLVHSVQVALIHFLSLLPNAEPVVTEYCMRVLREEETGFVNKALAASLSATVLAHIPTFADDWPLQTLLKQWGLVSTVATPLLNLTRELILRKSAPCEQTLMLVLPVVLNSDQRFCPLQREAALSVAKACIMMAPVTMAEWVQIVFTEIEARSEAIRPEEPGVVAALELVKFGLVFVNKADGEKPRPFVGDIGTHSAALVSILEKSGRLADASPGWNISIVGLALNVIQLTLAIEARVLGPQQVLFAGSHLSRYTVPLMSLLVESGAATSPEMRKAVMRLFRQLPRSILIYGLSQLAVKHKGSGKWGNMFTSKKNALSSSLDERGVPVADVTMAEYLSPVYKFYERTTLMGDRMAMIEILIICSFHPDAVAAVTVRTETLLCDYLRHASASMSTELSSVVHRHVNAVLPHIWKMFGLTVKSKATASKWLTFLRKHYEGRRVSLSLADTKASFVLRQFSAMCTTSEPSLMLRSFCVVFDAVWPHNCNPECFNDVISACNSLVGCLEADPTPSEAKETSLIMAMVLLGKYARLNEMKSSHFYESWRGLLSALPFGMGRVAWRLLSASAGHLLF